MTGWIIALLSGALMSVQGVFNTEVTKQTGVWVAAGWVQATALLTCVVIWLFTGRQPVSGLRGSADVGRHHGIKDFKNLI